MSSAMRTTQLLILFTTLIIVCKCNLLTTIAPYRPTQCPDSQDPHCYTSLAYPHNLYARAGDPVLMYGADDYYDLCKGNTNLQ